MLLLSMLKCCDCFLISFSYVFMSNKLEESSVPHRGKEEEEESRTSTVVDHSFYYS